MNGLQTARRLRTYRYTWKDGLGHVQSQDVDGATPAEAEHELLSSRPGETLLFLNRREVEPAGKAR